MEIRKAFNLLMQKTDEISKLRTLSPDNHQYKLWVQEVSNILELTFGETSREYDNFVKALSSDYLASTEEEKIEKYNKELDAYEIALDSALHKCALIADETPKDKAEQPSTIIGSPPKAFIAHGPKSQALDKLCRFLTALGIKPLVIEQEPYQSRSVNEQVEVHLKEASCAIVLGTADDKELKDGKLYPRRNVHIEIGRFQERFPDKTIYLLQENAFFPSNVMEKLHARFTPECMDEALIRVAIELQAFHLIKASKTDTEK